MGQMCGCTKQTPDGQLYVDEYFENLKLRNIDPMTNKKFIIDLKNNFYGSTKTSEISKLGEINMNWNLRSKSKFKKKDLFSNNEIMDEIIEIINLCENDNDDDINEEDRFNINLLQEVAYKNKLRSPRMKSKTIDISKLIEIIDLTDN